MERILGTEVSHSEFGNGTIVDFNRNIISVYFHKIEGVKRFIFPDCFMRYLSVNDKDSEYIKALIEDTKLKQEKSIQKQETNSDLRSYAGGFLSKLQRTRPHSFFDQGQQKLKVLLLMLHGEHIILHHVITTMEKVAAMCFWSPQHRHQTIIHIIPVKGKHRLFSELKWTKLLFAAQQFLADIYRSIFMRRC